MRVIPLASGKGGVGKSLFAANLAAAFAQAGSRVVLADLDLGASNLHLALGVRAPKSGIGAFLSGGVSFSACVTGTDIPRLRFIAGDTEIPGIANLKAAQIKALAKNLLGLADTADILILDLGAGSHQAIIDFFLLSKGGIVISAPALPAILGAYVFLKNAVFRLLVTSFPRGTKARAALEAGGAGGGPLSIPRLFKQIEQIDEPAYRAFRKRFDAWRPQLIVNFLTDRKDSDAASKIRRSCNEFLCLRVDCLGAAYRDSLQDTALASGIPIILYKPDCLLSRAVYRIADKIRETPEEALPPDERQIEARFQEADAEAAADFAERGDYIGELLHSGLLSAGELAETVKTQQIEINKLRKENNFLKYTLANALQKRQMR
ncbi:MAG: P-loop NTPase [Treponema sp.]|jgi:flagellar biosynthesis protein FlhG|nr:P-loop NTPase [Treponema sp.]